MNESVALTDLLSRRRRFTAPGYNMVFDPRDGTLARWGNTLDEDPVMCPVGPEIADIEISTVCNGIGKSMTTRKPCSWCYKSNTGCGENMTHETFVEHVFPKFPKTLTQIAFGIGDIDANKDLLKIMKHCLDGGVVPNLTTNGMGVDDVTAKSLADNCGAVAVSHYGLDDVCFDAVSKLSLAGLKQVNIHKLLSRETYSSCFELIDKVSKESKKHDSRLDGLRAVVFLLLKPKGDRNRMTQLPPGDEHYRCLIRYAEEKKVVVGMDSCSAPMALRVLPESCVTSIEPCESTLFSIYVNVRGEIFPCSFTEGTPGWESGIDMRSVKNFSKDVWYSRRLVEWRGSLLSSSSGCDGCKVQKHCRSCPVYDITSCRKRV